MGGLPLGWDADVALFGGRTLEVHNTGGSKHYENSSYWHGWSNWHIIHWRLWVHVTEYEYRLIPQRCTTDHIMGVPLGRTRGQR